MLKLTAKEWNKSTVTMNEVRVWNRRSEEVALRKEKLLTMAKRGGKRPSWKTKLGAFLSQAVCQGTKRYDPEFERAIKALAPRWFPKLRNASNQSEILQLAEVRKSKPKPTTKLGALLASFITPSSYRYDPGFAKKLAAIRPEWVKSSSQLKKDKLLEIANIGGGRPRYGTTLGAALNNYLNRSNKAHDPIFEAKIRRAAPHWFRK